MARKRSINKPPPPFWLNVYEAHRPTGRAFRYTGRMRFPSRYNADTYARAVYRNTQGFTRLLYRIRVIPKG